MTETRNATAEDFLSIKRELKSAEVKGFGLVYYYDPPSVAERDAYEKHLRLTTDGRTSSVSISMEGIVDGIIARLKTADSRQLFFLHHRTRLMEMPAEMAQQCKRHLAKAAVATRGADVDQPAAGNVVCAYRKRRRRLHRQFEKQHIAVDDPRVAHEADRDVLVAAPSEHSVPQVLADAHRDAELDLTHSGQIAGGRWRRRVRRFAPPSTGC